MLTIDLGDVQFMINETMYEEVIDYDGGLWMWISDCNLFCCLGKKGLQLLKLSF